MAGAAVMWTDIAALMSRMNRQQQNAARTADESCTHTTTGTGSTVMTQPYMFSCGFVGEPTVATGYAISSVGPPGYQSPRATAGVFHWVRDTSGLFRGAYLFFAIDAPLLVAGSTPDHPANPTIVHHLTFTGTALKGLDLPAMNNPAYDIARKKIGSSNVAQVDVDLMKVPVGANGKPVVPFLNDPLVKESADPRVWMS